MKAIEDYFARCRDQGFASSLEKDRKDLAEEAEAFRRETERLETRRERHAKIHRNPRKFIEQCCDDSLHPDEVTRASWHEACRSIHASKPDPETRGALRHLLLTVNDRADFLFESIAFGP